MKYFSASLIFLCLFICSCEKSAIEDKIDLLTPKEELLTASEWVYNEYFTSYDQSSARVSYKLGKPNSHLNLALNKVSFKKDRTYSEITSTGDTLKGTWQFLNGETELEVKNSSGSFRSKINVLNNINFTWHDIQRNIFARMLPSNYNQLPTISSNKLVGKTWKYSEYFTDFSLNTSRLAFKIDKPNNLIDLTKNRVTFNADGSITEIDEKGYTIPGTWKFISFGTEIGIEVNNYAGSYKSVFIYLDDSNYVWYEPNVNRYGKMTLASDGNSVVVSARAKALCSKTWQYTEYFSNYSITSNEALLSFKREKPVNNSLNLMASRDTFRLDGTYTEVNENGITINGTWQLMENETKLKVVNSGGVYTSSILQLNDTSFIWHDEARNTYGKMSPISFVQNSSINVNQLVGKTWTYYEYFTNYTTNQSKIVYKAERPANLLNLRQNTVVFNSNGSFNETNELGQTLNGTWDIINGQLQTTTSTYGSFVANLVRLDDKNLIWHNPTLNTYGKLLVKPL